MRQGTARQTELGLALAAAIAERGPITFAAYMQIALYHPIGGYYMNPDHTPQGWEGDYITSTDLHPLFGAAIGRQLAQIWDMLGQPDPFVVLEDGAGRGLLARDVFAWARDGASDAPSGFAAALRYHLRDVKHTGLERENREVETANTANIVYETPHPVEGQHADPEDERSDVQSAQSTQFPSPSADGEGGGDHLRRGEALSSPLSPHVILSNELIDALPTHVVERTAAGLREVYVDSPDGQQLVERLGPLSEPALADYLTRQGVAWERMPVGWRAEINRAADDWLRDAATLLAPRGAIITIDYGDIARRLYTRDRRRGTLIGYFRHELSDDPLALTGMQDLTAHVNFSALIATGRAHGLKLAGLVTQRDFLINLGIRDDVEALGRKLYPLADSERHTDAGQRDYLRRASLRHAVGALIDPAGMGGFRVLIQQRGMPGMVKTLRGLQNSAMDASI